MNVKEVTLPISGHKIKIGSVTAGDRNAILMELAKEFPNDMNSVMMFLSYRMLPYAIKEHPFNLDLPLKECLDKLDYRDYDKLLEEFNDIIKIPEDISKKSGEVSNKSMTTN